MNMLTSQNWSNCAFRYGFLRLATDSTAQSGFNQAFNLSMIEPDALTILAFIYHHTLIIDFFQLRTAFRALHPVDFLSVAPGPLFLLLSSSLRSFVTF
jgi:hypothetical protein